MTPVDYEIDGRRAYRFEFGDMHFLRVEPYDGYFSMGWSSVLPIATILDHIEPLLVTASGWCGVLYDEDRKEHEVIDAQSAVEALREGARSYSFARIELLKVTLVWEQAGPDDCDESGEFGLIMNVFDESALISVVRETATAPVSERASELVRQVGDVVGYLDRGTVF